MWYNSTRQRYVAAGKASRTQTKPWKLGQGQSCGGASRELRAYGGGFSRWRETGRVETNQRVRDTSVTKTQIKHHVIYVSCNFRDLLAVTVRSLTSQCCTRCHTALIVRICAIDSPATYVQYLNINVPIEARSRSVGDDAQFLLRT